MRILPLCVLAFAAVSAAKPPASSPAPHPFVADYQSEHKVPQPLLDAYVKFAEAAQGAQAASDLEPMVLPHAVDITTAVRPDETREYGPGINIPFLRSGFSPKVFSFRRDADDAWLVRTGTSAIWFVETKGGAWRVYRYLDKPIQ